jgi:hypothetical protein
MMQAALRASAGGHVRVLCWLYEAYSPWVKGAKEADWHGVFDDVLAQAVHANQLCVLEWHHSIGAEANWTSVMATACNLARLEIMRWIHATFLDEIDEPSLWANPYDTRPAGRQYLTEAIESGSIDAAKWVKETMNFAPLPRYRAFGEIDEFEAWAVEMSATDADYLEAMFVEGLLPAAVESGNRAMLDWVIETWPQADAPYSVDAADSVDAVLRRVRLVDAAMKNLDMMVWVCSRLKGVLDVLSSKNDGVSVRHVWHALRNSVATADDMPVVTSCFVNRSDFCFRNACASWILSKSSPFVKEQSRSQKLW